MSLSPNFLRRTAIASALALSALGASVSTASASVLWTANAERQWIQEWANYSCESGDRVQEVTSPVAQGKQAYKIEVRDGDDSYGERCELGQANPTRAGFPLFQEGDERWISYQVMLPDDLNVNLPQWTVIMQLKQLGGLGTPAVAMDIENGHFILQNSDTNHESSGCNWWWEGPAYKNRWLKFTYHIKFSPDDNVGWIELYGDQGDGLGMHELMPRTFMHTMKVDADGKTVPSQSRIGLYRDPAIQGTSHIYYDGYTVGTDRQSVEANAFGASAPRPPGVWLRREHGTFGAGSLPGSRMVVLYGGVRGRRRARGRRVSIQIEQGGRWRWVSSGRVLPDGRFQLASALGLDSGTVVRLRAVVKGVGRSNSIAVRVP
jgi:hypothetical protein